MGYTHKWNRKQAEIPKTIWDRFIAKFTDLLEKNPPTILTDLIVDGDQVFFNGSYETFSLDRVMTPRKRFGDDEDYRFFTFCKTAHEPYDKFVLAALILLATEVGDDDCGFWWSSDGRQEDGEHDDGLALTGLTWDEAVGARTDD